MELFEIFDLALLLLGAKVCGAIFNKLRQPALVGELLAGIILGSSILGIVKPSLIVNATSQLGLIFLILLTSLAIDWKKIEDKAEMFSAIELIMATLIFIGTYLIGGLLGWNIFTRIVIGVALLQSSLAIASRTLTNLGKLNTQEGETIIGFQVVDDIAAILSIVIVANFLQNSSIGIEPITKLFLIIVGFFVVMSRVGFKFINWLINSVQKYGMEEALFGVTLVLAFLLATVTEKLGMVSFLGVFLAGILLSRTSQVNIISQKVKEVGETFFIPIFFASLGLGVNIFSAYQQFYLLIFFVIFTILLKWFSSSLPFMFFGFSRGESFKFGSGMTSLSEMSLIVLSLGLAAKVLNQALYSMLIVGFVIINILSPLIMNFVLKAELLFKKRRYW
ncbi:MAG: cation:proton antiporter [Candidatus Aenigmatarchaeota archaeon]